MTHVRAEQVVRQHRKVGVGVVHQVANWALVPPHQAVHPHGSVYANCVLKRETTQVGQAGTTESMATWSSLSLQDEQIHCWGESRMDCFAMVTAASRHVLWVPSSLSLLQLSLLPMRPLQNSLSCWQMMTEDGVLRSLKIMHN